MTTVKGAFLRPSAILLLAAATVACESDRPQELSDINNVGLPNVPAQSNQNISNPNLTVAFNDEVDPGDTLTLVFEDNFDGTTIDNTKWFFETGDGTEAGIPGWGNNELQYYLPDNAQVENGVLKITALEQDIIARVGDQTNVFEYTSARINTRDRFAFRYGRIEASIKLPAGRGLWPAFWMLAQDSPYGSWAASGEIDIMEAINLGSIGGNQVLGTIHYGGEFPDNLFTGETADLQTSMTDNFILYAIEWDENEIRWYADGEQYAVQTSGTWFSAAAGAGPTAPFDHQFYMILNLAVGGNLPGSTVTANFPATMEVDFVRVYSGEP